MNWYKDEIQSNFGNRLKELELEAKARPRPEPCLDTDIEAVKVLNPILKSSIEPPQQLIQKSQEMYVQEIESNAQASEETIELNLQSQSNENNINVLEIEDEDLHTQGSIMEVYTKDEEKEKAILLPYTEQYSPNTNIDQDLQIVSHNKDSYDILDVDDDNVWPGEGEYDPMQEVVGRIGTSIVTRREFASLSPGLWIKDEVINFYFAYLDQFYVNYIFESSFFMRRILEKNTKDHTETYNFQHVKRWIQNDLFEKDKFILPINVGDTHWATGTIFFQDKKIKYFDSKRYDGSDKLNILFQFVKDAWKELNNGETLPDMELWKLEGSNENTPQQGNEYDCGAFCCMFALKIAKGEQLNFS